MPFEQFQERQVAVPVGLFDDAVEVADRLVVMENKNEPDGGRHDGNQGGGAERGMLNGDAAVDRSIGAIQ
jgi:hypothetical protein